MNPVLILWVISSAFAATYSDVNNLNKYLLSNYSEKTLMVNTMPEQSKY
jgi:hypothetical protein